jgi:hypothetical protein
MPRTILWCLCWALCGCWSRDNPADPGRCEPRCTGGQTCWEGICRSAADFKLERGASELGASELGVTDTGPDRAVNTEPAILWSKRASGSEETLTNTAGWRDIPGLAPITVSSTGGDYLFLFNVPDARTNPALLPANFGIFVDDMLLADGYFFTTKAHWHFPITIVGVKTLGVGPHTVKGRWYGLGTNKSVILSMIYENWLVAIRADAGIQYEKRGSTELGLATEDWTDIADLKPITLSGGGDYLVILNAPDLWRTSPGIIKLRILVDNQPVATGFASSPIASLAVPFSLFGVANDLAAGTHTVKAQWGGMSARLSGSHPAWLVAMRWPRPIAYGQRPGSLGQTHSKAGWGSMGIEPVPLSTTTSGNHLVVLNAPDAWAEPDAAWTGFKVAVDGTFLAGGNFQGNAGQRVPTTVLGVRSLGAGAHTLSATWAGSETSSLGVEGRSLLLGLSP